MIIYKKTTLNNKAIYINLTKLFGNVDNYILKLYIVHHLRKRQNYKFKHYFY